MKRILLALLAPVLLVSLAACPSGAGGQPGPAPSMVCMPNIDCPGDIAASPPAEPSPQIDAMPTGGGAGAPYLLGKCNLFLDPTSTNGISVTDGIHLDARVNIRCSIPPTTILLVIKLQYFHAGVWVDEFVPPYTSTRRPLGGNIPQVHILSTVCYPGQWRMDISVSGVAHDGRTPFGVERPTKPQRVTC